MSDVSWEKVETILDQVLDMPKEKRSTFIEEQCGTDHKLKFEVTQLLKSIFNSEGWLENPQSYKKDFYSEISNDLVNNPNPRDARSLIDEKVGSYLIKEEIGRGGMGTVYMAERDDQEFDHRVAIKIIRHGKVTDENIRRFRREQQILAELNHPNIARLFDGGITRDGYPFTIMELVEGVPIDDYCRKNELSLQEILSLLEQVLEAVQHAHENLVIHRDLKPGNILVDNNGKVKILDFGISKLLEEPGHDVLTQTGARLLTPRYAAPEQIVQGNITMATDLYAIGILFYQLLSGHAPFEFEDLSPYQMEQTILKKEPPRPSTRTTSITLQKQLRGDLDAIILKAIRKEPESRYRVATNFLQDLKNYSNGLPVSARDGSLQYRTKKFFRRHKRGVVVAAGMLLLIVGFAVFYTWRITEEKNVAQREAQRAEQVTEFMVNLFQSNLPENSNGDEIPVSKVLEAGTDQVYDEKISPVNRATIMGMIAQIEISLGDFEQARKLLDDAMVLVMDSVNVQNRNSVSVSVIQAQLAYSDGNFKQAEKYFQIADSLFSKNDLTHTTDYQVMKFNLVNLYIERKMFEKALQVLNSMDIDRFLANDEMTEAKGNYYNYRAIALKNLGQLEEALTNYQTALSFRKKLYNSDNPELATLYNNMSNVYVELEQLNKALELARKAYEIRTQALGKNHYLTGSSVWTMTRIAMDMGNYKKAEEYFNEALEIHKKSLGTEHIRYAIILRGQGELFIKMGRYQEAQQVLNQASSIIENNYPDNPTFRLYVSTSYAKLYEKIENYEYSEKYYEQSLYLLSDGTNKLNPDAATILMRYARMETGRNEFPKARKLLQQSLNIFRTHYGPDHDLYKKAMEQLRELGNTTKQKASQ